MPRLWLFIALVLASLAGCSRLAFVGEHFDDFSAYYNTFYNAEQALDECIKGFDLSVEDAPVDQSAFLTLFGRSASGVTQRKPCEDAILKSADVLRDHPNSKWVDDATLLIGKSWFFTLNFVGAEQKFREILALDSPLEYEARFWLARTFIASGAYDDAYDHLQATLSSTDLPRRWEPQYRLALAELHITRENWEEAAAELEVGIPGVHDSDLASRAQFLLGQVNEVLERFDNAVRAYDAVQRHKPWYELSYAAQYSAIRVLAEHGDASLALVRLRRMERDDKNYDYRAQLSYLRARTYQAMGRYGEALDLYDYLLYDEDGSSGSVRPQVHYALGRYYRDVERDFQFAAAHFDTAKTSLTSTGRTRAGQMGGGSSSARSDDKGQPAPGAIKDIDEQARIFGSFSVVMDRIELMDSLLYLGSLPDTTFDAWVLQMRKQLAEELEERRKEEERRMAEADFRGSAGMDFSDEFGALPPGKNVGQADMGFLYHRDEVQMQQALTGFRSVWGERPLARNWRRIAAVMAAQEQAAAAAEGGDMAFMMEMGDALPEVNVSDVPRDSTSQAEMRAARALAWYELGNVLFLSIGMPDSAAFWYREVIEVTEEKPVVQRAYYALAEVQRALGDTLSADRIYREILSRFEGTHFAATAAERLGLAPVEVVVTDTLLLAEALYTDHHAAWQGGTYASAMQGMMETAQHYPATVVAPRALFAAGSIYLAWAKRDSLDLFAPLPVSDSSAAWLRRTKKPPLADSVAVQLKTVMEVLGSRYPTSSQAPPARILVSTLNERWAIVQASLDSLWRVDSLATVDSLLRLDSLAVVAMVDSIIVSDSLLLPEEDSLMAVMKDSLFAVLEDSLFAVPGDSLAADSTGAGEDQAIVQGLDDALQQEKERSPELIADRRDALLPGGEAFGPRGLTDPRQRGPKERGPGLGNIDWSKGGYTIVVRTVQQYEAAVAFATRFGRTFTTYPVDVLAPSAGRKDDFRIGLGLFATITEAQQAMQQLQENLPEESEIVHIPRPKRF